MSPPPPPPGPSSDPETGSDAEPESERRAEEDGGATGGEGTAGLLGSALRGVFWTSGGTAVQAILQIVVLMVLARLLTPEDFGLLAAALVVTSFSDIFAKLGVGPALVQRAELEARHRESALLVSVALGVVMGAAVYLLARPAASFFQVEGLVPVIRVMALLFPVTGLGIVSQSHLNRDLAFRTLARIQVLSYAVGYSLVGIGLALLGAGVWALVGAVLGERVLGTAMAIWARPPPRRVRADGPAIRELLGFGGGHTAMRLANFFAMRGDYLVTGRILGVEALGLYERAYRLMAVPVTLMSGLVDRVLFPTLSKVQDDPARLGRAYLTVISLTALGIVPLAALSFVLAPEIVRVFLGAQWGGAVAPFRILVVGMYLRAGYRVGMALAQARGAVYRGAWRQAVYAGLVVGGAWVGSGWGLEGVAAGVLLALLGMFLMTIHLVHSITGHGWLAFLRVHLPPLGMAAVGGGTAWSATGPLRDLALHPLVTLVGATGAACLVLGFLLWRIPNLVLGPHGLQVVEAGLERVRARLGGPGPA